MKKLGFIFSLVSICLSCNTDNSPSSDDNNENLTLLQKLVLYHGTPNERHWNFNADGLLYEVTNANGNILTSYSYDNHKNITTINHIYLSYTENFQYDNNNILTGHSYNDDPINNLIFNSSNNTYYSQNSINVWDDYIFNYNYTYYLNEERLLCYVDSELIPSDYESLDDYYIRTTKQTFTNGNITTVDTYDIDTMNIFETYTYDNQINPLKQALLPISRVSLFPSQFGPKIPSTPQVSPFLSSNNNVLTCKSYVSGEEYEGGNPPLNYIYIFNDLGLPTEMRILGIDSPESPMLKYYYQGDILP